MKQLEVQIMGQSYILGCPDGGDARLLAVVERVDSAMCKIREVGKVRARDRIAVLAALNLAFDLSDQQAQKIAFAAAQGANDAADSAKATALIKRLDAALNHDDRLL